jgi:adenine-specific DNA methylase
MLKRLIEVALPLKEVSEQSAREKSIRHGHISTLHIWWARRPLAACRAVVFASLIPDPDDPQCPESFRQLVKEVLGRNEFKPKNAIGERGGVSPPVLEDTPRNRCLEFIKHLVKWENSNNPTYIEPARTLIAAAHKLLHPDARGEAPKVLDPFAGGGAIPLEALRLGCEAHAIDLNPVAHLIELCTLVYPQKYGQPDTRPLPEYIKRLIAHNKTKKKAKGGAGLFDGHEDGEASKGDDLIPDVEITEVEYRKNPLAADVKYWGHWVLAQARREIGQFYPADSDGRVPVAYLWARTVTCPNPACGATIPLIRQLWLCKKAKQKVALRLVLDTKAKRCRFEVSEGKHIDFDPNQGTMQKGSAACPFCQMIVDGKALRTESKANRMGQQLMAVVTSRPKQKGKKYRAATVADEDASQRASLALEKAKASYGAEIVPDEAMTHDRPSPNSRGLSGVVRYGLDSFGKLFNARQALTLTAFVRHIRLALEKTNPGIEPEYCVALVGYLALAVDRAVESDSTLGRWIPAGEKPAGAYGRQALGMVWDYCEVNLLDESPRQFSDSLQWVCKCIDHFSATRDTPATVQRASASALPVLPDSVEAVLTDPPYYDSVPYGDLSDFFYVWLKRSAGGSYPQVFRTPLTPKGQELIAYYGSGHRKVQKPPEWYEAGMQEVFAQIHRGLNRNGVCGVMFAHKTTSAWESIIAGLIRSGLIVTSSWPLHTERPGRLLSIGTAALASSVTLVCRKRLQDAGDGLWDDVRQELRQVVRERLDFFWSQHIRGADFSISAIGPALSVFGRYKQVTKLSGEEVTVSQFLDEVRGLVTNYALTKILKTTHTANIDSESRFYVVWKWSYGDAKVPADESFKLAQALGMSTEIMWDRTGVLEKAGENVQAVPVAKRMKIKGLGEPDANGTPASLIDVLHRMCVFREKGDTDGMAEF